MSRFLVWLSGPGEDRTAPWFELPLHVAAEDSNDAIAKAIELARGQGRLVDRLTATLLPEEAPRPPIGELGGLGDPDL